MPLLNIKGLRKSYGALEVVAGIDIAVNAGECFGLLGPNGAGKTTTLRLALGLTAPDSGTISLFDLPVPGKAREARIRVGVVPQMDNLDPDFTVRENLMAYGRYFGLKDAETARRIPALLEFAGLEHRADARIDALSGGMKRRLTLARALVNDPDLIFLDEPTTGLDPQARHMIWQRLRELINQGKTLVLTTHFMEEAERLCDRLCIMDRGKIIATGSPRALIEQHIEPEVLEVVGEEVDAWAEQYGRGLCQRLEKTGEMLFCYTRDSRALLEHLKSQSSLRYLHRPASLEDVFLKLTGKELRD
ncbi:MAG: ATP-binding cassette domain-containing protein [Gammaproteobacteria bacterium]|nr:ATP-binding cassette domain-containing protein [Gammaproteobacteria bacterium]